MITVRNSRGSSRAVGALALTIAIVGVAEVSAHRRDEYLQAARLGIDPGGVQLELDLTPGIALAETIIADIDRNRDGTLSPDEQRAYVSRALSTLRLEIDGTRLPLQQGAFTYPAPEAMRRGEGSIRLQAAAILPHLSTGAHQLLFRNSHDPDRSVYLANALVPSSDDVAITGQRRDGAQTELTIDYVLHAAPARRHAAWLLGSLAAAILLSGLLMRRLRSVEVGNLIARILPLLLLWAGTADGAVVHVPIKSNLVLKPGEAYTINVEAKEPVEIGWQTVQAKSCTTDCVQATDVTGGINATIATPLGASLKYTPAAGKITVEYKNVSSEPVTITIYRVQRTCEAEACRFLDARQTARWLVFKVGEFTSITTSADGSYSVMSGVTIAGRPFTFRAVWWTDDKSALMVNCSPSVKKYLDTHAPKEQYSPYVISGQAIGEPANIVLTSVDTCAAKAAKFGVPEANVFK
jgi:hypothetical protein